MNRQTKRNEQSTKKRACTDKSFSSVPLSWYPGHMAKTKRLLKEIKHIDYVVEVIDGRAPLTSKVKDMEDIIKNKPAIYIVTKMDLADFTKSKRLLDQHYAGQYILFDKEQNNIKDQLELFIKKECLDILVKRDKKGIKNDKLNGFIIGIPNAGKSTVLNRIISKRSLEVGNKPGVTKAIRPLSTSLGILYDVPGLLWPKITSLEESYKLSLLSAINEDILPLNEVVNYLITFLSKEYPANLKKRYKLEEIDLDTIYDDIGRRGGYLLKGGEIDYDRTLKAIYQDFKTGRLGRITLDK